MKKRFAIFLMLLWWPHGPSFAQLGEQILFPATMNSLRVLPAELEYEILDSDSLNLGGRVFQARATNLELISSTQTLKFKWNSLPDSKLSPLLTLRDNTGRIVWSKAVEPGRTQFTLETSPENILPLLQSFPFFRFCANFEIETSQAFVCSKEYFLSELNKNYQLKTRTLKNVVHSLEINGRPGGPRGKFFLLNGREPLHLKVSFASGTTLEFFLAPPQLTIRDVRSLSETGVLQLKVDSRESPARLSQILITHDKNEARITHGLGPEIRQPFEVITPPVESNLLLSVKPSQKTVFFSNTKFNVDSNSEISLNSKHPRVKVHEVSKKQFRVEIRDLDTRGPQIVPFEVEHRGQTYLGHLILQKEDLLQHRLSLRTPGQLGYRALSSDKLPWQALTELDLSIVSSGSSLNSSEILLAAGPSDWSQKLSHWTLLPALNFHKIEPEESQIQSLLLGLSLFKHNLSQSWFAETLEFNLLPFSVSGDESMHIKARLLTDELATEGLRLQIQGAFSEYTNEERKKKSKSELAVGLSISF
jgi:hypothetical protein